jgi:hypothetical protein
MNKMWLRLTDPMMCGPAVRRWQELLEQAGYVLDGGVDGWFGSNTEMATREAQKALGVTVDGIVGPKTLKAMQRKHDLNAGPIKVEKVINGVEIHDYRGKVPWPKNGRYMRDWSQIAGVMLHRTACVLGESPRRYFAVNAHIGVTLEGRIILPHDWELMIWHGHGPSPWTIGIEIDGNPEGYPGYHWRPGGGPHPITDAQAKASEVLLEMLTEAFEQNGSRFKYIVAHRQSSNQRECDPGWECWQKIAIPWMEQTGANSGGEDRSGRVWGTGYRIPQSWDPSSPVVRFRQQ